MKLCICSDSHGNPERMQLILNRERPGAFIFLGDGERDARSLSIPREILFAAVRGNGDAGGFYPKERILTVEGKRLLLTHGHLYRVKQGLALLQKKAGEVDADIILYGHTHLADAKILEGKAYFNPGMVCGDSKSYLIVQLDGQELSHSFRRAAD